MALRGRAFLAIWHDIAAEGEADYDEWHTRQHMPERLGIPGFLLGRRCVNWDAAERRWFTLYETETLETLSSDGYRARLNSPTRWSGRVQPHFRNFTRSACVLAASVGQGVGGVLATFRLDLPPEALVRLEAGAQVLTHRAAALPGVVGVHVGVAAPETTRVRTRESELRAATGEAVFDAVLMIEATGRRVLADAIPGVRAMADALLGTALPEPEVYDLAFLLPGTAGPA